MRIAYGVHGYNRGHASRAMCLLPALTERHEVCVFAGEDAYDALCPHYTVHRIPSFSFEYDANGQISALRTLKKSAPKVRDILGNGPALRGVVEKMADFRPDVILTDAEAWTHRAGRLLGIPRINFDHFGIMAHCRVPLPFRDRLGSLVDRFVYRTLMGGADRILISSFYDAPPLTPGTRVIGPLLREEVRRQRPEVGDRLLVYLNKGASQLTPALERALHEVRVDVDLYGAGREGRDGRVHYRPLGSPSFVEHLARCRALISTAGNQLMGEAIHFKKPMLVMPELTVEQRLNASAVQNMGIGRAVPMAAVTAGVIREFLTEAPSYSAQLARAWRDGRAEALDTLERWFVELSHQRQAVRPPARLEEVIP